MAKISPIGSGDDETIEIGERDSVLIFRDNGDTEAVLPKKTNAGGNAISSMITAAMCIGFLNDEKMVSKIKHEMETAILGDRPKPH